MIEEKTTPLRERMIEDMRIRGMSPKTQQAHIRAVRYFAEFIGRSPDTATPDELRAYQLHMTDSGVSTGVFNARIVSGVCRAHGWRSQTSFGTMVPHIDGPTRGMSASASSR